MSDRSRALSQIDVSRETLERLELFEQILRRWITVTNLVGPTELNSIWTRHFVDSLQLRQYVDDANVVVDMGTGAGFPGLVLAIDAAQDQAVHFHLIEPDGRKCAFLREIVRATGVRVTVHRARAEDVLGELGRVDIITSRAMSRLENLVAISEKLLRAGTTGLFPKGRGYQSEVEMLGRFSGLNVDVLPSLTSTEAAIIRVRSVLPVIGSLA